MSERDRNNPYGRNQQHGGGQRGGSSYDSPRQANQWQSESRQQGGDWMSDAGYRDNDDDWRDNRYASHSDTSPETGSPSRGSDYRSERGSYGQQASSAGGQYARGKYGSSQYGSSQYGGSNERYQNEEWQRAGSRGRYGQRGGQSAGFGSRNYDASGGNDFGNFTSEDYGGRDFYNRGGGVTGGNRSSESYRPSYGVSSWFDSDDDDRRRSDYGDWQRYGESRGFFERAGDEIASWFGDEDASRRRERDHRENHSGRGPSGYTRSDERIREDANDHLTHDWGVDASNITVSVKDGEVTLSGTVDSRQSKRRAEDAVERVSGVKHVQNNLRVHERSSSRYGSSSGWSQGGSGAGGSGLRSSSTGQSAYGQTGSSSGSSATSGSSTTGSSATGASTTEGIGSTATAGIGSASSTRSSDKTS